ncbi:MAG: cytochrome c [Burkholderiales bacterium]|nr:MAG: cytochrome c [Burkholderiales bacterium]
MSPRARRTAGLLLLAIAGLVLAVLLDRRAPPGAPPGEARDGAIVTTVTNATNATNATTTANGAGYGAATPASAPRPDPASPDPVARGAYLALAGNCAGCHTARGGVPYAGGRGIETPFGTIHASNLTPDAETGLGAWQAEDFRRALREGRSRDGRALYPAFPYTEYTRVSDADADALFAYLRSLEPARAPTPPHALRFPWNLPWLLEGWRMLYFRPARFEPDPARDAAWNRGAYLVEGLGHCGACHTARNLLGAQTGVPLGGAATPLQGWHVPSLLDGRDGGVGAWTQAETVAWLGAGLNDRAVATGPMAQVVANSLQHLVPADLEAMASYLRALPRIEAPARPARADYAPGAATLELGGRLYRERCADCHGERGEGAPPHWPALAGNRSLTMASSVNAIRTVLHGGFPPATRANPRPYGMPPAGPGLDDSEAAALMSWLRNSWGHTAPATTAREINALRPIPVE